MILNEFDSNQKAIINAWDLIEKIDDFPEVVVSCFARETFNRMIKKYGAREITNTSFANIEIPIYVINIDGVNIGLVNSYVGSAGCVALFEDLIAFGMKKLVLFGTCGVLDNNIEDVSIVIPNCAIRDEGTSYHYAKSSDDIVANKDTIDDFVNYLNDLEIKYTIGKVWTTDGIYRETLDKYNTRKEQGCIVVDMECSAIAAWSQFRNIKVIHFFYSADKLSDSGWEERSLSNDANIEAKDIISELAINYAKMF